MLIVLIMNDLLVHCCLILRPFVGVMAVLLMFVSVLLLSLHNLGHTSFSCPVSCRCYSLTVECGSTGLRDIPKYVPPFTQVCFYY